MKIYVTRHGQTDWNVQGKTQGRADIELNEVGIKQAKQTKEELKNIDIDLIICSPLKRAKKTAEIINEGRNIPIIFDDQIIERNFGEFEGEKIKFSVKGYGHGVGMSQTGADTMAKEGKNYEEIIKHFYIGVEIKNM